MSCPIQTTHAYHSALGARASRSEPSLDQYCGALAGTDRALAHGIGASHITGMEGTKICPFCSERVKQEAVKCRYCGEWLEERKRPGSR